MATYTIGNRPKHLRDGDKVIFEVGGKESKYYVSNGCPWLRGGDDYRDVFKDLEISPVEKKSLAKRCFGYTSPDTSYWPSAKHPDHHAAHCRLVNALYDLIEEREGKKTESNPDKGDNEPGTFLGYDWALAGLDGLSTELSKHRYETIDAACEDAAEHGYEACVVFKLYAVGAKKYTRKFVQED